MPSKSWFRVHTAILHSRKVQTLPPAAFKWLVNFWAAAAGNEGVLPPAKDLAWTLHCAERAVQKAISELRDLALIDEKDGHFTPHDWSDWQFESDSSAERVKRFRDKKRNVTGNVAESVTGNVTVTPSRARDRAEQSRAEQTQTEAVTPGDEIHDWITRICDRHPNTNNRILAEQGLVALCADLKFDRAAFDRTHEAWCRSEKWNADGGRFVPQLSKWIGDKGYRRMPPAAVNNGTGGNLVTTTDDAYGWMPPA